MKILSTPWPHSMSKNFYPRWNFLFISKMKILSTPWPRPMSFWKFRTGQARPSMSSENLNICKHEGHWMGPGGFVWEKLKSANMKDIGWGQGVSYERNWKKHCPPWSTKNPNEISDRAPAHQTPQILRRLNWFLKKNHDSSLNSRNFRISRIFVDWASRKSAKNREKIKIQIVNTDFSRLLKNPRSLFGFWLFLDFLRFFSMPSPENPAGGRKAPPPEPFPLPKSSKWSQSK